MRKINLYKIETGQETAYQLSSDPIANGEVLASYNNIEEIYPTVLSNDITFQTQIDSVAYHSKATRASIGVANSVHQTGTGNSQFGTQWVYSEVEQRSKKIRSTDNIPAGWQKGRKIKFNGE